MHEKHLAQLTDLVALSQLRCDKPIKAHLVYATRDNFVGQIIDGYTPGLTDFALLTKDAAEALCLVQNDLLAQHNLSLLVFDSYRPKRAVIHFMKWMEHDVLDDHELHRKNIHYPDFEKNQLFDVGYLSADSQHCYGHTVDLVLIDEKNQEIDLGACFDFLGEKSHWTATAAEIGEQAFQNRHILGNAMQKHGFKTYAKEFWHYSFKNKPIQEPINIEITGDLKKLNV